ncbi:hypothetical protein KKF34_16910 [Myxococcota bacterium]|nr:hypothetical protein [Myxococcota bacterium]MBU1379859.1 hypothetical protein [Myxococcota bacterium]MBU1498560.1 hypothetical protein [Myxococcota bacterium]
MRLPIFIITMVVAFSGINTAKAQDKVLDPGFIPALSNTVNAWELAPANFMAEGNTNIYLENVKKPMHAWFLAFVPGAFGLFGTLMNKNWDNNNDEDMLKYSKFYFAAIPVAMGSMYSERYWEALGFTVGQSIGTYFIYSYFNLKRSERNDNINNLYMGIGIYAFFWVVDMIYAPIMAWQYNKKLAKLYLQEASVDVKEFGANSALAQLPSDGKVLIGPGLAMPTPFMLGTTFKF